MNERITVRLTPLEREVLDEMVKAGEFKDITEAVREAIQQHPKIKKVLEQRLTEIVRKRENETQ